MIRAGALGYVTKTIDTAELLAAIADRRRRRGVLQPAAGGVRAAGVLGAGAGADRSWRR